MIVTWNGRSSAPASLSIVPVAGGVLAPPSFRVGGKQYLAALHASGSFVNASVPDVAVAPATPGETVIVYGIGFGEVTPGPVAGQIAAGTSSVATPVQFLFGDIAARVDYAGLAPDYVGLYQFNVVIPAGVSDGDVRSCKSSQGRRQSHRRGSICQFARAEQESRQCLRANQSRDRFQQYSLGLSGWARCKQNIREIARTIVPAVRAGRAAMPPCVRRFELPAEAARLF